jgi:hypothetical protein
MLTFTSLPVFYPASMWVPIVKHFFCFFHYSDFIPCNSIAGKVPVREWAPN